MFGIKKSLANVADAYPERINAKPRTSKRVYT
jgi:hypothetical protein